MIVLLSRRTRAEVEGIRQSLGIFHPFVCESGGGAFVPRRYLGADLAHARRVDGYQAIDFGSPYDHVVETLRRVAATSLHTNATSGASVTSPRRAMPRLAQP